MVAVLPEARGRGISGKLLGHALADAAERGNETATLVATTIGLPGLRARGVPGARADLDVGAEPGGCPRPARRSPRT